MKHAGVVESDRIDSMSASAYRIASGRPTFGKHGRLNLGDRIKAQDRKAAEARAFGLALRDYQADVRARHGVSDA